MTLRGCFRIFFLYDVAEALDFDKLRDLLGPRGGTVKQVFPRRTPEYVRFEQAPIVEPAQSIELEHRRAAALFDQILPLCGGGCAVRGAFRLRLGLLLARPHVGPTPQRSSPTPAKWSPASGPIDAGRHSAHERLAGRGLSGYQSRTD